MDTKRRTALILEDEPLIAMDVEYSLREAGFDVAIVGSCAEAIEWLKVRKPDIVIADVVLRDGPCHAVVEQFVHKNIPFVVHSGDVAEELMGTPYEFGVWLSKRSKPADLIEALKEATSTLRRP